MEGKGANAFFPVRVRERDRAITQTVGPASLLYSAFMSYLVRIWAVSRIEDRNGRAFI